MKDITTKILIACLVILYVISPIDAIPANPIDDFIVVIAGLKAIKVI